MSDAKIGLPSRIEPGLTLIPSNHERDGVHVVLDAHPLIRWHRYRKTTACWHGTAKCDCDGDPRETTPGGF